MQRIVYIIESIAITGGLERILIDKLNAFSDNDYDVILLTTSQGSHPLAYPLNARVSYIDLATPFHHCYRYSFLRRSWNLYKMHCLFRQRLVCQLASLKPDIIVCVQPSSMFNMVREVVGNSLPIIVESHASYYGHNFEKESLMRRLNTNRDNRRLCKADTIVSLTHGDAEEWGRYTKNVVVIPNIVHLNSTGRLSALTAKKAIYPCRLEWQKGLFELLDIWAIVQQHYPDWQLDIYGDGSLRNELSSIIARRELNIVLHPSEPDIFSRYLDSSMLLLTSIYESFGLIMPEAMSCGLPVVAFDCPYGPGEIVTDGEDGFLVKDRNIEAFAQRVCQLIENAELRQQMGKDAIQKAQRYSVDNIMPLWKELFGSLKK